MQTQICLHRQLHAHPGTPRQIQGQELLDTPTWGQGKRQAATAWWSSRGGTHPRETKSRAERRPMHIPTHRFTGRCCHTGVRRSRCHPHRESHYRVHACMHTQQLRTAMKDSIIQKHTHVHMCLVMQPSLLAVAFTVTQANKKTQLHLNTCVHNLATSIFLDSAAELRFCRQSNLCYRENQIHLY